MTSYAVMAEEALGVAVSRRSFEHFYPEEPWIHQVLSLSLSLSLTLFSSSLFALN
jgi:hypothetical protein